MSYQARNGHQSEVDCVYRQLGGQVVALRVDWAERLSSIHAALVLQQLIFEARHHADADGWFFITAADMRAHTAVAEKAYQTARSTLVSTGLIETKRAGVPAKTYVRFNTTELRTWLFGIDPPEQEPPQGGTRTAEGRNKNRPRAELLREGYTRETNESSLAPEPKKRQSAPERGEHARDATDLPSNGPAQQVVKAFCAAVGIDRPASYPKAVGQAQQVVKAGVGPDDIPGIVAWLYRDPFWSQRGIDIGTVLSQIDKWRATQHGPTAREDGDYRSEAMRTGRVVF